MVVLVFFVIKKYGLKFDLIYVYFVMLLGGVVVIVLKVLGILYVLILYGSDVNVYLYYSKSVYCVFIFVVWEVVDIYVVSGSLWE